MVDDIIGLMGFDKRISQLVNSTVGLGAFGIIILLLVYCTASLAQYLQGFYVSVLPSLNKEQSVQTDSYR
jgi:hypothetical protein